MLYRTIGKRSTSSLPTTVMRPRSSHPLDKRACTNQFQPTASFTSNLKTWSASMPTSSTSPTDKQKIICEITKDSYLLSIVQCNTRTINPLLSICKRPFLPTESPKRSHLSTATNALRQSRSLRSFATMSLISIARKDNSRNGSWVSALVVTFSSWRAGCENSSLIDR